MCRNIVLCFDGTNNKYAATNTNVVKLYGMLDRAGNNQLAYYQPGIGTIPPPGMWGKTKRWLITKLDLAIAWLLPNHVMDGYRFLMRFYRKGDRVFIFGFSRGAYTARALAAMLHKVGLLLQGNEELVPFAWDMFKNEHDWKIYTGFRHTFGRRIPIHFLGLWDTVSSVGWAWNPKTLPFTANNPSVEVLRHAVALDERRAYFRTNLWGSDPEMKTEVLEVWFPGVHCDVGGGYKESEAGLSKIALRWMVDQAKAFGLVFNAKAEAANLPIQSTATSAAADPTAMKHESLHGWWWIAEFIPKRVGNRTDNFQTKRWIIPGGQPRYVPTNSNLHPSIEERINSVSTYKPTNLPIQS